MLNAILGLFTSFNPMILAVMLGAGAYIALRHRILPLPVQVLARAGRNLALPRALKP